MERRKFLKQASAGAIMPFTLDNLLNSIGQEKLKTKSMPSRFLGKTGLKVSLLGIGGWQIGNDTVSEVELEKMINYAESEGINYIDTAPNYGDSEEKLGRALEGRRENFVIATKTEEADYDGTWRLLEQSLKRIKTDYLDIVNLHSIGNLGRFPDMELLMGSNGALKALRKAKDEKIIGYYGASGHNFAGRFNRLLEEGDLDLLMNAVNFVVQHSYDFENRLWERAREKGIGLVAMKVLGGAAEKPKGFRLPDHRYADAFAYVYSLPGLSNMVIGFETAEEISKAADTLKATEIISEEKKWELYDAGLKILLAEDSWKAPYGSPIS